MKPDLSIFVIKFVERLELNDEFLQVNLQHQSNFEEM